MRIQVIKVANGYQVSPEPQVRDAWNHDDIHVFESFDKMVEYLKALFEGVSTTYTEQYFNVSDSDLSVKYNENIETDG